MFPHGLEPLPQGAPSLAELERVFSPESWTRFISAYEKTIRTGEPYELELEVLRPDGRKGWELARGEPLRDASGEIVGLRGIAMDISERKQAEEEARRSTAELKRRNALPAWAIGRCN